MDNSLNAYMHYDFHCFFHFNTLTFYFVSSIEWSHDFSHSNAAVVVVVVVLVVIHPFAFLSSFFLLTFIHIYLHSLIWIFIPCGSFINAIPLKDKTILIDQNEWVCVILLKIDCTQAIRF